MIRRLAAIMALALLVGIVLLLFWTVHEHHQSNFSDTEATFARHRV